jgi:hypothetical protein
MAEEQYVTRDQHRADMAQWRGELKEEIAGGDLGTRLERQGGTYGRKP